MYLIYCACSCTKLLLMETVLFFCHTYPRVKCELMLIQGETFFWLNALTFQRLVYLKIRNTTLARISTSTSARPPMWWLFSLPTSYLWNGNLPVWLPFCCANWCFHRLALCYLPVHTQGGQTYCPADPPCFWQETQKNPATKVPRPPDQTVRLVGRIQGQRTVSQAVAEALRLPECTEGLGR